MYVTLFLTYSLSQVYITYVLWLVILINPIFFRHREVNMSKLSKRELRKMRALEEQGLDVLVGIQPVQTSNPHEENTMTTDTNIQNQAQLNQAQPEETAMSDQTQTQPSVEAPAAAAPSGFFDWKNAGGNVSSKWVGAGIGAVSAGASSVLLADAGTSETLVSVAGGIVGGFGCGLAAEQLLDDGLIQYGSTAALAALAGYGCSIIANNVMGSKEEVVSLPTPAES